MRHILIAIVAMAAATVCHARTIIVDDNSPADFNKIKLAINDANDGDTIIVQPGRYTGDGNRDIRFLGKAITVQSIDPYDPNIVSATIIACGGGPFNPNIHRGFKFDSNEGPSSVLAGLTITGGYGNHEQLQAHPLKEGYVGGGIFCKNSSPTITHCNITKNAVATFGFVAIMPPALGGGICYWGGKPTISHCVISNNETAFYLFDENVSYKGSLDGGGIYGYGEGKIVDCIINNNTAITCGGGIYCIDSEVLNCTIKDNNVVGNISSYTDIIGLQTYSFGGGIYCDGNTMIDNCVIKKNSAIAGNLRNTSVKAYTALGGGVCARASNPTSAISISNSVIAENSCKGGSGNGLLLVSSGTYKQINSNGGEGLGGGIYFDPCCTTSITNCLIAANITKGGHGGHGYPDGNGFGGGAYCGNGTIINCTFATNEAIDGAGIYGTSFVINSILWDVIEQNSIPVTEVSGGATVQYSDIRNGYTGEGNIDFDPCFVQPGYWLEVNTPPPPCFWCPPPPPQPDIWIEGDYHLLLESLCIDAGDQYYAAGPNETDLDGNSRISGQRVDMGAYEYQPPVDVQVDITPKTLNLKSNGQRINCTITLPDGHNVADVNTQSILLEDRIQPKQIELNELRRQLLIKFDRNDLQILLSPGRIELMVTGSFKNGSAFDGIDIITVINPGKGLK